MALHLLLSRLCQGKILNTSCKHEFKAFVATGDYINYVVALPIHCQPTGDYIVAKQNNPNTTK